MREIITLMLLVSVVAACGSEPPPEFDADKYLVELHAEIDAKLAAEDAASEKERRARSVAAMEALEEMEAQGSERNGGQGNAYEIQTKSWCALPRKGAPVGRWNHSAVWTGSEMIVWGGTAYDGDRITSPWYAVNTGGAYNPKTNSWRDISSINAPAPMAEHTAHWTGALMLVWGWHSDQGPGGIYDPKTDTWTKMSRQVLPRYSSATVWTGTNLIVFAGATGNASFDPETNSWAEVADYEKPSAPAMGAPIGVWTGTHLLIWGYDLDGSVGRYDPKTDSWERLGPREGWPKPCAFKGLGGGGPWPTMHLAFWSGTEMLVWDGHLNRFDPSKVAWKQVLHDPRAAIPFFGSPAVYTGTHLFAFGDGVKTGSNFGSVYSFDGGKWESIGWEGSPKMRGNYHSIIWTGEEAIVWGGKHLADR